LFLDFEEYALDRCKNANCCGRALRCEIRKVVDGAMTGAGDVVVTRLKIKGLKMISIVKGSTP